MEQLIAKPLKRFLYTSKEFAKRRKDRSNLRVHFTAGPDEADIAMSEMKSIFKTSPVKQITKSTVLFNDNIETISANLSTTENNESAKLVKVKMVEESVKEVPTILNLTKTEDASLQDNAEDSNISAGDIQVENFTRRPSVVRIKVVINKNKSDENKDEPNIETTHTEPKTETTPERNLNNPDFKTNVLEDELTKSNNEVSKSNNELTKLNNESHQSICEAKSIEDFQNIPTTNKHDVAESCIFDENKSRPLSPIPVLTIPVSPKSTQYTTIDNLIDFHERQLLHRINKSPTKSLPRMGMSSLVNRSPSKLEDSEIISQMVKDRFVVNTYESRSFKRNIKKPSTYGRIYKTIERTVNIRNDRNDFITKNLLNNDIVTVKQSSPIKSPTLVRKTLNKSLTHQTDEEKDRCVKISEDIKKSSTYGRIYRTLERNLNVSHDRNGFVKQTLNQSLSPAINKEKGRPKISEDIKKISFANQISEDIKKPSTNGRICKTFERTVNVCNDDFVTQIEKQSGPVKSPVKQTLNKSLSHEIDEEKGRSINQISEDIKNVPIAEEFEQPQDEIKSTETLCFEEEFQPPIYGEEFQTHVYCKDLLAPSSEYGSGSNSIQSSTVSLEKQLLNVPEYPDSQYEQTFESDASSYNMEEFLKKALGDELNNLDNTEAVANPLPLPSEKPDASISTSNASALISTSTGSALISKFNTFQSQFYRSFTRKLQHVTGSRRHPHSHEDNRSSVRSDLDSLFSNNEEVAALLRQAAVQFETLKQISKALTLCRNSKEFCVSSEQVEGERLLLVATYKRQSIISEIRRLEYSPSPVPSRPAPGTISITSMTLPVRPPTPEQPRSPKLTKWYVAVVSSGLQVAATQPTLVADGCVRFKEEVVFEDLEDGVEINLEVYCLLQRRLGRNFSHESKYHINKDTKRSNCPTPKKFLTREWSSQKLPARNDTGIRTSSFKLCGSLKLTVGDLTKSGPWELRGKIPLCSSVIGTIALNLHSSVEIPIRHSGFLTVGSESGGCAAWNRRWCVLEGHVIKYWNYPSEEETPALKELDLKYCVSSKVRTADRALCARPRSLLLEIARKPKSDDSNSLMVACAGSYTIEIYYLSADNLAELNIWQEQLDKVVQSLRIWNVGFLS